jgi:Cys-tRNA(Pro) deacylase
MAKHISETPATQWLKQNKVAYTEHPYDYVDHGGTAESSKQLGVPEHHVIKTLVMQDEQGKGLVVLMHGNCKTSTKNLARQIGCKTIEPCKPEVAQKNSGYLVGGTSPFGLRKQMPIYVESSILELTQIWINGGRRGFLVGIAPQVKYFVTTDLHILSKCKPCFLPLQVPDQEALTRSLQSCTSNSLVAFQWLWQSPEHTG